MNILALPLIASLLLAFLFWHKTKKINSMSIVVAVIGLAGSLTWVFMYSSFEDAVMVSGFIFFGGWLFSLGIPTKGVLKEIYIAKLANSAAFIIGAVGCLLGVIGSEYAFMGVPGDLGSYGALLFAIISGLYIYKKAEKYQSPAEKN